MTLPQPATGAPPAHQHNRAAHWIRLSAQTDGSFKDWTLCDAISFAVLDTRRVARAFTFDHHFRQYGRVQVLGLK